LKSNTGRVILATFLFLLVWFLDGLIDFWVFRRGNLSEILFHPPSHEAYLRAIAGLAISLGLVMVVAFKERSRRQNADLVLEKERYLELVESNPACMIVHRQRRVIYANRKGLEYFGLKELGSYLGADVLDFIMTEDQESAASRLAALEQDGTAQQFTLKVRLLDGQCRDVTATSCQVRWAEEKAVLTYWRDITEMLDIQRNLMNSRERLQLALDAARDGVWDWNIATGQIVYNEAWARMLGYTLEELGNDLDTWRQLIHPQDYLRAQAQMDSHLQGHIPGYEIEVRLRHKRGNFIWVLDRGRVVERDETGAPLRMTGTHRDITARKEAELALEIRNRIAEIFLTIEGKKIFSEILTMICQTLEAPVGIFTTLDSVARLQVVATLPHRSDFPAAMESALTFDRKELPPVFDRVINQNRFFLSNKPLPLEGHLMPIESVLGVPISSRDQVLGGLYLANRPGGFLDSDRLFLESLAGYIAPILQSHLRIKAKESQLRQAQKMEALGALAGGIAHDFNNILQAIMGFTTLALEDAGTEGNVPGDLQRVLKATRRGQELVKRILLFSRREEQKYLPMEIQDVIIEAINLLKPSIPSTIEIEEQLEAGGALVFGDPGQISQIVLNLATNSYHAMEPDGGHLNISLQLLHARHPHPLRPESLSDQELVVLEVTDTGAGMSSKVLARLFDPFFTTKQVGQGTGLGMSVVHGIVKAHQGDIMIQSELEIGTKVTVFLPRWEGSGIVEESPPIIHKPIPGVQDRHIVLVDDEADITDLGKALLERSGHRVTAENNPRVILDRLEADRDFCDLVITDLTMPQITGLQLAGRLEKIRADLPVILITGMTDQALIDIDEHTNIKGLIRKPFGGEDLRMAVDKALEDAASKKES
jgi:PAS domain S-box-containing protein